MKKIICLFLSALFLFSFAACSTSKESPSVSTHTEAEETFDFLATDLDGNIVRFSDYADAKVLMINFWEPWCQPCLSEMPDLENLWSQYKDRGLVILGVFTSTGMDEDIRAVQTQYGISYPLLRGEDERLLALQTDYVPTTVFVNADGRILTQEPIIGAKSLEEYEAMIKEYLR